MGLSARQYIFYLTLVFACGYATAGSIAKRQTDGSSNELAQLVQTIIDMINKIPLVGNDIGSRLEWLVNLFNAIEMLTNGAIARLLGGALPCTISLEGTYCTGLTTDSAVSALLLSTLEAIPSYLLPDIVKSFISLLIQMFLDPVLNVLFGGIIVNS